MNNKFALNLFVFCFGSSLVAAAGTLSCDRVFSPSKVHLFRAAPAAEVTAAAWKYQKSLGQSFDGKTTADGDFAPAMSRSQRYMLGQYLGSLFAAKAMPELLTPDWANDQWIQIKWNYQELTPLEAVNSRLGQVGVDVLEPTSQELSVVQGLVGSSKLSAQVNWQFGGEAAFAPRVAGEFGSVDLRAALEVARNAFQEARFPEKGRPKNRAGDQVVIRIFKPFYAFRLVAKQAIAGSAKAQIVFDRTEPFALENSEMALAQALSAQLKDVKVVVKSINANGVVFARAFKNGRASTVGQ